jgi:hypothetical protein
MEYNVNSLEVQQVLAEILNRPAGDFNLIIKNLFQKRSNEDLKEIIPAVQHVVGEVLDIKIERNPNLLQRLRFAWIVLKRADKCIWNKSKDIAASSHRFDLNNIFADVIKSDELHECFLSKICSLLALEPKGNFLKYYAKFLRANKPRQLKLELLDSGGKPRTENLRRMICWIIRKSKDRYIDIEDGSVQMKLTYFVDGIEREELPKWCAKAHLDVITNLTEEIENMVNGWLSYSCLDGENEPDSPAEKKEIAEMFLKDNELKTKLKLIGSSSPMDPLEQKRIKELESEISKLEEENGSLKSAVAAQMNPAEVSLRKDDTDNAGIGELQDFLKIIDSKYSFDVLRSIQLGDEHSITIKNFIAHLFYSLRKKSFISYPEKEQFDLDYDQSGLYQCINFEVPPGGQVRVKVEREGWAIRKGERLFPVRKAVLRQA